MNRRCFSVRAVLWTAAIGWVFVLCGCGGPSAGDSTSRAAPSSPSSAPPPPPPPPPPPDLASPVTAASAPRASTEANEPPPVAGPAVAEPAPEPPSKPADVKVVLDPPPAEEKRPPTVDEVQQAIEQAGGRVVKEESGRVVRVFLNRSQATDETMQLLQYLPDLEVLNLTGAKVSDAGLAHLARLRNLKRIYPAATQITDAALSQLQQSLPQLRVMK